MNAANGFTTALGWPMPTGRVSIEDELLAHGLHPRDPRLKFAATALRASRPKTWPKLLARFGHTPAPVPLPAPACPIDHEAFDGARRDLAAAMQSKATARRIATPEGGWSILSHALLLWLSRMEAATVDDIQTFTFILQETADEQIRRVDAAVFYAVSAHAEWRSAAVAFLAPYRETWAADYIAARPEYQKIAAAARAVYPDVPEWLCFNRL